MSITQGSVDGRQVRHRPSGCCGALYATTLAGERGGLPDSARSTGSRRMIQRVSLKVTHLPTQVTLLHLDDSGLLYVYGLGPTRHWRSPASLGRAPPRGGNGQIGPPLRHEVRKAARFRATADENGIP